MALQIDTTYKGLVAPASYASIAHGALSLFKDQMSFVVNFRSSPEAEPYQTTSHSCAFDVNGGNPFTQAYSYLKTLPEFDGAADC